MDATSLAVCAIIAVAVVGVLLYVLSSPEGRDRCRRAMKPVRERIQVLFLSSDEKPAAAPQQQQPAESLLKKDQPVESVPPFRA